MQFLAFFVAIICIQILWIHGTDAFQARNFGVKLLRKSNKLYDVPLELEGKLDPQKKWMVKFVFNGESKEVLVSEGTSALETGEKIFKGVESSCRNGVCTTCAGKVSAGIENVKLAVHGLGQPQIDAGFVCTCQCYVCGPGVVIELGKNDEVYESQYGQYEESYEMKFSGKKEGAKKNKLFGI